MQRFAAESPLSMTSSAGENTDAADENNSGMQEALSALGALSSLDLDDFDDVVDENLPDIKYSRTDDTPLSNYGKSTVEEAELYLEMWDALEGSEDETQSLEEGGNNYYEEEEESASDEEEISVELETDELPWTSINPILRLRGPVATGYGRGGKKLGVPTANVSDSSSEVQNYFLNWKRIKSCSFMSHDLLLISFFLFPLYATNIKHNHNSSPHHYFNLH